jgi:hypothetical protein
MKMLGRCVSPDWSIDPFAVGTSRAEVFFFRGVAPGYYIARFQGTAFLAAGVV